MTDNQIDALGLILLRTALLLAGFWLFWAALRRQPRAQVALCRAIAVALLVIPLVGWLPMRPMLSLPVVPMHEIMAPPFITPASSGVPSVTPEKSTSAPSTQQSHVVRLYFARLVNWLPIVWAIGSVLLLIRWRWAWLASRQRLLSAEPASPEINALTERFASQLDLYARVTVRLTADNSTPALFGPRPVMLIPRAMARDESDLTCAIAHELVHVRGNDWWWSQALSGVQALFWPIPLVWPLRRAHDRAAEMVCDSLAAPLAGGNDAYAGTLARQGLRVLGWPHLATLPMARSLDLRQRIERLLSGLPLPAFSRRQSAVTWTAILLACAILAAVGLATRQGVMTFRADESPNQAFGWNDHRLSDILLPPHSHDQF